MFSRGDSDTTLTASHVHRAVYELRPPRPRTGSGSELLKRFPMRQHQVGQVHLGALCHRDETCHGQVLRVQAAIARGERSRVVFTGAEGGAVEEAASIVEVLLARLLHLDAPARYQAVIHVECESDGEICASQSSLALGALLALLSRLSSVPLRQDLLVIAAVDLEGRLAPISGVNEQIEDACRVVARASDSINAGVIIPAIQRTSLMLAPDVLQAAANELFQIFGAGNMSQTLELLAGGGPGVWRDSGFSEGSMMAAARSRLSKGEFFR